MHCSNSRRWLGRMGMRGDAEAEVVISTSLLREERFGVYLIPKDNSAMEYQVIAGLKSEADAKTKAALHEC